MKKGFTLLELIVVMIIIGILATLGIQQYARATERARGAEARQILGQIRSTAAGYYLQNRTCVGFNDAAAGLGGNPDQIPRACRATHYFYYFINTVNADGIFVAAVRCSGTDNGKQPGAASVDRVLTLTTNFANGVDTWSGNGGY
ncbi:MAG: prepilin-type N-terminal cleavage/methylation domain-containing protein [Candidatus Omnitrophica bacterium]|nr:prepilin-type N-terminal cleavage/methylation domain-containing protein [Candidatus Omnitrophota bacterium]MDD5592874.1 prepilin-type N-terminal cleavage/methylation domain-containing protein [Candidatus Omnitrophota bacterium]